MLCSNRANDRKKHTFLSAAAPTAHPHKSIQKCVTLVTSLHRQVDAILVAARIDAIGHGRVIDFLKNVLGASQPSICTDDHICRWLVGSLQHVACAQVSGVVLGHDLGVLTTGLFRCVSLMLPAKRSCCGHLPEQCPCPNGRPTGHQGTKSIPDHPRYSDPQ